MTNKPTYKLRKEDFIPVTGYFKYLKRNFEQDPEHYFTPINRTALLAVYNLALTPGIVVGLVAGIQVEGTLAKAAFEGLVGLVK